MMNPLKKEYRIFFFFPFYHTGGAEKVHALITQATGNKDCIIYFTRKSVDNNFYDDFVKSGCEVRNISKYTDNKFLYFFNLIFRGIITGYINRQKIKPIVFNGQCNFGYKISPWVKEAIPQIELIHSFNTFSWIRIPFIPFITQTVMISRVRIEDHYNQYKKIGIPRDFQDKITLIINGIPLPEQAPEKEYNKILKVLYVGRGTEEKRVHLIAEIAKRIAGKKLPVQFLFMGDVSTAISSALLPYCKLLGHQSDQNTISKIYENANVIIITSSTEGFPLAIQEGMAHHCVVLATPVGDIPVHINPNENGFLFTDTINEEKIIKEGIDFITLLHENRELLKLMGTRNHAYAFEHFGLEKFTHEYRQLFKKVQPSITF
jgi:L-malate glycosyltransferase